MSAAKHPSESNAKPQESDAMESRAPGFSPQTLARLWPNRVHESNWLKNLVCILGLHRWHELKFEDAKSIQRVRFCRWCSLMKLL